MNCQVSDLAAQLALGLALSLRLAGEGEVGEVVLGTLCVRSEQLRFLGVQEGEGLGARPVSLHTHLDSSNFRFTRVVPVLACRRTKSPACPFTESCVTEPTLRARSEIIQTKMESIGTTTVTNFMRRQRVTFSLSVEAEVTEGKSAHSDLVSGY